MSSVILIEEYNFKKGAVYFLAKQMFNVWAKRLFIETLLINVVFPDIFEPVNNKLLLIKSKSLTTQFLIKVW